ncbi:sulfurtransferase complex subunit TusC [Halomonas sp. McH1-25]|uniref:sulfurtransferase complex subunit TusC n=1 Tax=unclassified Halomonas TaxID=2609666 RepID=UPI001EF67B93|nr:MULTISPECIES: sulfurtransferase complex subunit TusC [unclassified Halomonas]MCG7598429.1 sulfurtransferase complex subunit TusC [Halomonas sp. McH1-25]MCP1343765.1 sulfurtransferase complex subunit TusC [Halomonas sp. FL8]MCP1361744.1 sulfurtransferase complex subunit TusC [Halomonas sp. BBD45]
MSDTTNHPMLVVLRHAPHGSSWLREGLDVALVGAALGKTVNLLFLGDGVLALRSGQQHGPLGQKGTHPTLDMLEMYDIDTLLVDSEALTQRGLTVADLQLPASPVEAVSLPELFAQHSPIYSF